jgi:acetyl esterase/lipase
MRVLSCISILSLAWIGHSGCASGEGPEKVIEKAIAAHGGQERLGGLKAVLMRARGTVNLGAEVPFTWAVTWQSPQQLKIATELELSGQKVAFVQGHDGTDAWGSANGAVAGVEGLQLEELRAQLHLRRVLTLAPLLDDKAISLVSVDDAVINGKAAAGVQVSAPHERDLTLYFDRGTGLLVRVNRLVLDDARKQVVPQEDVLSDYRETDGVQTAFEEVWSRAGRQVAVLNYDEVSYPEKVDEREFERPPPPDVPPGVAATRTRDVIYGRKLGMALTLDVFTPETGANGAAVILVVSGGWVSDNQPLNTALLGPFVSEPLKRGYAVFAVFHGSQPKFTVPEVVADINRAVRFIRAHAEDYGIDPHRIGITGGSAGGHLSLMQGTAGDLGDPDASDPVERESSRVQAVACLFPPTDFLNYGGEGKYAFGDGELLMGFRTAVDVRELDLQTLRLERTTDEQKQLELAATISPITHVSADDPPTLIVHGDADTLVPIQQAEAIVARFGEVGVRAELITRPQRGHDFNGIEADVAAMTDWFDTRLTK